VVALLNVVINDVTISYVCLCVNFVMSLFFSGCVVLLVVFDDVL
jgi:hypothetical protein